MSDIKTPAGSETQGCEQCRKGAYGGSYPPPQLIAINGDGPVYLHQCSICNTFWQIDMRFANPIPEAKARQEFPAYFTSWLPKSSGTPLLKIRSDTDFPKRDPLSPGGEPPEGELEIMLAASPQDAAPVALMTLLKASLLQVPSTTPPAADGSGMTPMVLNRPPVIWVLAFTRLELARRFADNAHWCIDFAGSDLIARLPPNFGLHLNFGAGSERQIKPAELSQQAG